MCDALQSTLVDRWLSLETQYPVQIKAPEYLLIRMERFETVLGTTFIFNQTNYLSRQHI